MYNFSPAVYWVEFMFQKIHGAEARVILKLENCVSLKSSEKLITAHR